MDDNTQNPSEPAPEFSRLKVFLIAAIQLALAPCLLLSFFLLAMTECNVKSQAVGPQVAAFFIFLLWLVAPWLAFLIYCELKVVRAKETILLANLKTDSEPLIKLAAHAVKKRVAMTISSTSAESAVIKVDANTLKPLTPKRWAVCGTVTLTDVAGIQHNAPWSVDMELNWGKLEETYVKLNTKLE